ncbi:MAG: hypothetical protein ACRC8S_14945 [Fimbriiglobus sp.]
MPRKKKTAAAVAATEEAVLPTPAETVTLVAEPVRAAQIATTPAASPAESLPAEATEKPAKTWASGPQWENSINLSTSNTGPKMRLGRNNKYRQMVIQFDEAPCADVLDLLHEAEWRRRPAEGVWTQQMTLGHEARGHQEAANFFEELAGMERQARGLEAKQSRRR